MASSHLSDMMNIEQIKCIDMLPLPSPLIPQLLPEIIVCEIFTKLELRDRQQFARSCKYLHALSEEFPFAFYKKRTWRFGMEPGRVGYCKANLQRLKSHDFRINRKLLGIFDNILITLDHHECSLLLASLSALSFAEIVSIVTCVPTYYMAEMHTYCTEKTQLIAKESVHIKEVQLCHNNAYKNKFTKHTKIFAFAGMYLPFIASFDKPVDATIINDIYIGLIKRNIIADLLIACDLFKVTYPFKAENFIKYFNIGPVFNYCANN